MTFEDAMNSGSFNNILSVIACIFVKDERSRGGGFNYLELSCPTTRMNLPPLETMLKASAGDAG